jgi:hypothetical protein
MQTQLSSAPNEAALVVRYLVGVLVDLVGARDDDDDALFTIGAALQRIASVMEDRAQTSR